MEIGAEQDLLDVDDVPSAMVRQFEQEKERDDGREKDRMTTESLGDPGS